MYDLLYRYIILKMRDHCQQLNDNTNDYNYLNIRSAGMSYYKIAEVLIDEDGRYTLTYLGDHGPDFAYAAITMGTAEGVIRKLQGQVSKHEETYKKLLRRAADDARQANNKET
jgi:hypothetical protein